MVSPVHGALVESSSGFFPDKPNRLEDAFRNYYVDPNIYAASAITGRNYFVVNLNRLVKIKTVDLKFHWDNYPIYFTVEGWDMVERKWVVLIKELSNERSTCNYQLDADVPINKLRLIAYDYHEQKRLLMDKFIVKPLLDKEEIIALWTNYAHSPKLEFLHIEKMVEQWSINEELTIEQANKDLIGEFSEAYLNKYDSPEFWTLLWGRNKAEGNFYLIDPEGYGFSFDNLDPVMENIKK